VANAKNLSILSKNVFGRGWGLKGLANTVSQGKWSAGKNFLNI
jgi:hypothetical protein